MADMNTGPTRVLVVEDDKAIRELLKIALPLEGYEVDTAPSGMALTPEQLHAAHIMLSDAQMPSISKDPDYGGIIDVVEARKAHEITSPLIVMTASNNNPKIIMDRLRERGIDISHEDILAKPFVLAALMAALEKRKPTR